MANLSSRISDEEKQLLKSFSSSPSNTVQNSQPKKQNLRVRDIAEDFGIDSKVVSDKLWELNERVKGPSSTVIPPVYRKLKAALELDGHRSSKTVSKKQAAGQEKASRRKTPQPSPQKYSGKDQANNQSTPRKHRAKSFVFQQRLVEIELSKYKGNPTNSQREQVLAAFEKLRVEIAKNATGHEKSRLTKKIKAEMNEFKKLRLPANTDKASLNFGNKSPEDEKALKPYAGLHNKTPNGPLNESYWDNPVQDR